MWLGSDSRGGLDYLSLPDDDRILAVEALKRAAKMKVREIKFLANQVAKHTWGKPDPEDEE